ncbi:hypothetical protein M413DRAFT_446788 [Hebeloma cylindrosporum]|uniref:Uncharacterized protein n=1 Tax=Hebeloma cylindrosporum TaxID=76867 RepID=A0A0C3BT58_HEBCY|nr:hypothetical protein M413DRAFT_446788 [Hebeloma cylindrosporum h7]
MLFSLTKALSLLVAASGVFASPLARNRRDTSLFSSVSNISFNNWGGLSSLAGFDDFFGIGNFDGFRNDRVLLVGQQHVCQRQRVSIIQQQLAIIQEVAKQVISQQICDVETQIVVFEQFRGGLRNFRSDLRRQSGHNVGFDASIAILALQLFNQDGTFSNKDFGFRGIDVGKNLRVPSGNNWDDSRSPQSIDDILRIIGDSRNSSVPRPSTNGTVPLPSTNGTISSA